MTKSAKEYLAELGTLVSTDDTNVYYSNNIAMTTGSDINLPEGSGINAKNGFGTSGQVLTTSGSDVYWSTPGGGGYVLPIATTTTLGGVKVDGSSIKIDGTGVISASGGGGGNTGIYFNVKDFGALGNGSHDDTDNIQNAINAAGVSGGTVYFPTGGYLISKTLVVNKPKITLLGDNLRASIIFTNDPTITMVSIDGIDTARVEKIGLYRNVKNVGVNVRGFSITNSMNVIFENVDSACNGTGYYVYNSGSQFFTCRAVHDNGSGSRFYGWFMDSQDGKPTPSTYIVNSYTIALNFPGTSYGVFIYGKNVKDVFLRGFESATNTYGIWVENTGTTDNFDIEIADCVVDTFFGEGIVLANMASASIVNCWVNPAAGATNSIRLEGCRGVTVTGNQLFGGPNYAKQIGVLMNNSYACVVSSCIFNNNLNNVKISNGGLCSVIGSTFFNFPSQGAQNHILINNSFRCAITGNILDGTASTGLNIDSTSGYNIVTGNSINPGAITKSINNSGGATNVQPSYSAIP